MRGSTTIGAMVDYGSAAIWLPQLRSAAGLREWLARCRHLGLTRLYFRVSMFGDFLHHTSLENRLSLALLDDYRDEGKRTAFRQAHGFFHRCDVLAGAIEEGHRLGMEIVPWLTLSDEGIPGRCYTRFATNHPEYLVRDRNGQRYDRALSYGHQEVRDYRISLIREVAGYGADGVFLDFTRWLWKGHVQSRGVQLVDEQSVCQFGYDEPVVAAFRSRTGQDPQAIPNGDTDWVRFRAEVTNTQLLRQLRASLPGLPVYVYFLPRGFLSEMLLDVPAWVREGLVDQLCPAAFADVPAEGIVGRYTYARWNDFARQFSQLVRSSGGCCTVGTPVVVSSSYGPHPDFAGEEPWSFVRPEVIEETMLAAVRGGAHEIVLYDLCQEYNGERQLWESLEPVCRRVLSQPRD